MDTVYFVLLLAFCFKYVLPMSVATEVQNNDTKIIDGVETTIQQYPYQAYLLLYDGRQYYQCGGSIIDTYYILTAAHCLARIQTIYVRIGSTYANMGGFQYTTEDFESHPLYNDRTSDYDVGIVTVNEGMDIDGVNTRIISLARVGNDPAAGINLILTGWGKTDQDATTTPNILHVTQAPVVERTECNTLLGGGVTSRMICAGETTQRAPDTCQGDSGGPAVSGYTGRQVGITSYGFGCGNIDSPGVYTRIGSMPIRSYILARTGV